MYARVLRLYYYTGNVSFRSKLSRTFKLAKKQQAYFSSFGDRRTEPVLRLEFPRHLSFIPSCPSTIEREPNIGIKLRPILARVNVSLPSSIAENHLFRSWPISFHNLFQIATNDFHSLALYSKICTRIRGVPSCFPP